MTETKYPLHCVDYGDATGFEGPFDSHDAAHEAFVAQGGVGSIRSCRAIKPSDLRNLRRLAETIVQEVDMHVNDGEHPEGAWYEYADETAACADLPAFAAELAALLDKHVKLTVYVCEGDE